MYFFFLYHHLLMLFPTFCYCVPEKSSKNHNLTIQVSLKFPYFFFHSCQQTWKASCYICGACKLRVSVYINQSFSPFIVILCLLSAFISPQHPFLFSIENSVCILTCYLCCMLLFSWILLSFSHHFLPFGKPENTYIPFTHCKFATDLHTAQQADVCTSRIVLYI